MEVPIKAWGRGIARRTGKADQHMTAVPGFSLRRRDEPTPPISVTYEPRICVNAQGAKHVLLRDETYGYGRRHFLSKDDEAMENITRYIMRASFIRDVDAPT